MDYKTNALLENILRQKAEALLKKKSIKPNKNYSDVDIFELVHEFEVYQIELEMQNEELSAAMLKVETEAEKYSNLYDFAPSGYITLSKKDEIVELNFSAAALLGKERMRLINKRFAFFIANESKPTFTRFLQELFEKKTKQTCEIELSNKSGIPICVILSGIVNEDNNHCAITMHDISQRKKAEETLKKSQVLLHSTLESQLNTIIFSIDDKYNYLSFNKAHSDAMKFAYNADVKIGMNILACISSIEDRKMAKKSYDRALSGETHSNIRLYGDIATAHFESFFNPILDVNQKIIGATGLARNITKRIQQQENLKISEEKYRTLFETNRDSITILRLDKEGKPGNFIEANPATTALFGYTKKELCEMNIGYVEITSTESRKSRLTNLIAHGKTNFETIIKNKKGDHRYVEVETVVVGYLNEPAVMNIARDITDRKKSEELVQQSKTRFSSIINCSPVAMALNDELLNITYLNRAFVEMFGYTVDEILTVEDWFVKAYPEPKYRKTITDAWVAEHKRVAQHGSDFIPMEVIVRCKNGSDKIVLTSANPLSHSHHNEYLINFYDITERKKTELLLENEKRRLAVILIGTGAGTWEWNIQTGATVFNERWAEIIGYTLQEITPSSYDTLRKFIHTDDLQLLEETIEKYFLGKHRQYECEFRMMHKSGDYIWILAHGKINEWDLEGKPLLMSGTHLDITERKLDEEKLIASENFLKQTQIIANLGSFSLDFTTQKWTSTVVLDNIFGINTNFEKNIKGWTSIIHPDWRETMTNYINDEVITKKLNFDKEYKIITIDNKKERWVHGKGEIIFNTEGQSVQLIGSVQDITERKISEKTLLESEEKYRSLVENSPDGVVIYIDDRIAFINGEGIRLLNAKSKEEIIGKPVLQFVHPDCIEFIIRKMTEVVKENYVSTTFEVRFLDVNGVPFDVEVKGIPTTYEHKNAIQILVHDITLRKQTSLELNKINRVYALISQINNLIIRTRSQEELFQEICNIAVDFGKFRMSWIGLLNDDHLIKTAAFAGYEKGYFTKNVITTSLDAPEGNGPTGTAMREGRTVICNDISKDPLMKPWREDALERGYFSVISIPIIVRSKIIGAFNLYAEESNFFSSEEEITLLEKIILNISFALEKIQIDADGKKTEEKIRQLSQAVEQSPASIIITNTKGEIEYINPKFVETTGYSIEEVLGQNPRILKSDYTSPKEYKELWETITAGNEWQGEFRNKRKDGTLFWESSTISPIINIEGKTTHFIAITEDITRRKIVEKELIKSKERAEESDRLKLVFLANMSHEIRTPMNGILGFTELLKEPKLSGEEQQEYISIIEKSGRRMLNIINDIISISKVESGQTEVTLSETNINEQIEYINIFFKPEANPKGIELFVTKKLAAQHTFIKTDREKVYAVLTNLVKNAIKFTNEGSIEFGCEKKENYLEFFVKDSGLGIPKSQKKIIFERFRQANESISRTHEGSGLGLAISKAYVEMLGGKIWVESIEGKGSTFYFTIPFNAENASDTKIVTEKTITAIKKGNTVTNLKVLIVEDDAISKLLITIAVKPYSKEIIKVSTGIEAIEACRANPDIDLVMMDINMPIMGGYEATKLIREFNKDLVIIAQTANGMQGDRDDAIASGCTDYIAKPINISDIGILIQKYFSK